MKKYLLVNILFLFVVGKKDAQILAEEYNKPEIANAHNLPPGVCYVVKRHQPVIKLDVFDRGREKDEPTITDSSRDRSNSDHSGLVEERGTEASNEEKEDEEDKT